MQCGCDSPGLMPLEQAKQRIWQSIEVIQQKEVCLLENALDRILAEDIVAPADVPPYDNSAMDGYALKAADLAERDCLRLVGKSFAGKAFEGKLANGECVRIMTGAMLPAGADSVMMQENTRAQGDIIYFQSKPMPGDCIRRAGEDISTGQRILLAGQQISALHIGQLAGLGLNRLQVFRKLKVAILSSGDELIEPGEPLTCGKIYDSNRPALKAMLGKLGVEVVDLGIIADDKQKLTEAFNQADQQADLVLTSGGVSVGEADYTREVLLEMGQLELWKLAIKPGKPLAFGLLPNSYFFGLPGNPVSALLTFHQIVLPSLQLLSGKTPDSPMIHTALSQTTFKKKPGRTDFQRAICWNDPSQGLLVKSVGKQGSGLLSSMTKANCYVVLEQDRGQVIVGEKVNVLPFDQYLGS